MRLPAILASLTGMVSMSLLAPAAGPTKPPSDPRITSIHPYAVRAGVATVVTIRGNGLTGARAIVFAEAGVSGKILSVGQEPAADGAESGEQVRVEVTAPGGLPGTHAFRVVSATGVSNELSLRTVDAEVVEENSLAGPLTKLPVVVTGKLAKRGEVDTVWIEAKAGETLTFSATGGIANFDPSLTLAEPSGSWFDEGRLNRIAFNDEPLHFPGLSADARLVHRFEKSGRYVIQVRAFSGQGGPDYSYQLRMERGIGAKPSLQPRASRTWEERQFVRPLGGEWVSQLEARAGRRVEAETVPVHRGEPSGAEGAGVMGVPGIVEGRIGKPAETHRIRVRVEKPQDLAIEIETPEATMPRFNPVVRLIAPGGGEVVTNVYTKRNNNGLYMMKMIQAKSTFTLRSTGDYLMEIRDITTDVAGDDFAYRVLVRPQVAHVGKIEVVEDRVNLEPGQSKPLTIHMEREEGFKGLTLLSAEGLPPGVTVSAGMANPIEKPPLPNGGRLERYTGKQQTTTLLVSADENATPSTLPVTVRVTLRTVVDGRQSPSIVVKELPVMVIPRRPS